MSKILNTFHASTNTAEIGCRLFIAGSWIPKATVQAALASTPLDMILEFKRDDPDFSQWKSWGQDITTTAIFAIIITAPIGLVFISYYGDKWLSQDHVKIRVSKDMRDFDQVEGTVNNSTLHEPWSLPSKQPGCAPGPD